MSKYDKNLKKCSKTAIFKEGSPKNNFQKQQRNAVKKMNEEIYYVSEREDIKTKIIKDLEKRLI